MGGLLVPSRMHASVSVQLAVQNLIRTLPATSCVNNCISLFLSLFFSYSIFEVTKALIIRFLGHLKEIDKRDDMPALPEDSV